MPQSYHSNAVTNVHIRCDMRKSNQMDKHCTTTVCEKHFAVWRFNCIFASQL